MTWPMGIVWLMSFAFAVILVYWVTRSIERATSPAKTSSIDTANSQTRERRAEEMVETPKTPEPRPEAPEPVPQAETTPAAESVSVPEPAPAAEAAPEPAPIPGLVPLPQFSVPVPEKTGEQAAAPSPEPEDPFEEAERLLETLRSSSDNDLHGIIAEAEALTKLQKFISQRKRLLRTKLFRTLDQLRGMRK